ncbi:MAG: hypothetical protein ACE37D_22550 [Pseudomonadales bacterium]|jgi:hypothetical protein
MKSRISKEEALAFLLTYIIVDRQHTFELNPLSLFNLTNLAAEAELKLSQEEGLIPHELIEALAEQFIETNL